MVDKLKAIRALYPNAMSVEETEVTDEYIAKDINGNEITVDSTQVAAWVDPDLHKYARQLEYAPLREQLDMMYHDKVNGTNTWKEHIDAVKAAHPKGTD